MKQEQKVSLKLWVTAGLIMITLSLGTLMVSGCCSVPPEQEGSSIPWSQPEEWEHSGLKTGMGF